MTTAVDTNILLDIFIPGAPHGNGSEPTVNEALKLGKVIVAEAVCRIGGTLRPSIRVAPVLGRHRYSPGTDLKKGLGDILERLLRSKIPRRRAAGAANLGYASLQRLTDVQTKHSHGEEV